MNYACVLHPHRDAIVDVYTSRILCATLDIDSVDRAPKTELSIKTQYAYKINYYRYIAFVRVSFIHIKIRIYICGASNTTECITIEKPMVLQWNGARCLSAHAGSGTRQAASWPSCVSRVVATGRALTKHGPTER